MSLKSRDLTKSLSRDIKVRWFSLYCNMDERRRFLTEDSSSWHCTQWICHRWLIWLLLTSSLCLYVNFVCLRYTWRHVFGCWLKPLKLITEICNAIFQWTHQSNSIRQVKGHHLKLCACFLNTLQHCIPHTAQNGNFKLLHLPGERCALTASGQVLMIIFCYCLKGLENVVII